MLVTVEGGERLKGVQEAIISRTISNPTVANSDGSTPPSVACKPERRWKQGKEAHRIKGVRRTQLPDSGQTEVKNGGNQKALSAITGVFRGWSEADYPAGAGNG